MNKKKRTEGNVIRRIVVATDFSAPSNRAFEFSVRLSKKLGAGVLSVFVKDADDLAIALRNKLPVRHDEVPNLRSKVDQMIQTKFESLKQEMSARNVSLVIRQGEPVQEIIKVVKKEKADLIITGTRSRSLLSRVLLGSTARNLILGAPCPVLTVK
jgi:nucleotide-binding universal stress UspA family protein